ncbi:MAG: hypothetical protein RR587_10735 [Solibacillus sp.]
MKRKNHLSVMNNPNYRSNGIEETSWRKAAEVFDKYGSDGMLEDAREELKKIRRKYGEEDNGG